MRPVIAPVLLILTAAATHAAAAPLDHPQSARNASVKKADHSASPDQLRAQMLVRQHSFEQHIAERSDHAIRSICVGCIANPISPAKLGGRTPSRPQRDFRDANLVDPVQYLNH